MFTVVALLVCAWLCAPAQAAHVQCGDTITADTTLDSDLTCDEGLDIGADSVTLDLDGHMISGPGDTGIGVESQTRSQVVIRDGTIRGFRWGVRAIETDGTTLFDVHLDANTVGADLFMGKDVNTVVDSEITGGQFGLNLDGRIQVARNTISGNSRAGILLDFTRGTVEDNTISENGTGIDLEEAEALITHNRIVDNEGAGIQYGYWQEGQIVENTITGNGAGINDTGARSSLMVTGNVVRANDQFGIRVSPGEPITGNRISRNGGSGLILVDSSGAAESGDCPPVAANAVWRNGKHGIEVSGGRSSEDPGCLSLRVVNNHAHHNSVDGISVKGTGASTSLIANRVEENADDGVDVGGQGFGIAEATWSPDGEQIAARVLTDPALAGIYLFAADGSTVRRLVSGAQPSWAPSGNRIAYGNTGIHTIGVDGSNPAQLTSDPADSLPQWSPAGDMILFQRGAFINVVPATGGPAVQVARGTDPEWSPDGTRIVYQAVREIRVVQADGSGDALVVEGGYPAWSPDGNRIAFTDGTDLATVAIDGSDLHYLTVDDAADWAPDWSPDGTKIAFLRASGSDVGVWVVAADGGPISRVGDGNTPPEWPLDRGRIQSDGTIVGYDGTLLATLDIDLNPFVTIARNRADRNADLGIEAVSGVTDGGGNRAMHNGDPRQCLGVSCR